MSNLTVEKSASLYFKEGSSDKVYYASVEKEDSGYVVNFSYGRRGNALQTGTKTNSPVSLNEAIKIWQKLVDSKTSKGYRHKEEKVSSIPQAVIPDTPTESRCVLLNPIDENEAKLLLDDSSWVAQEKFDGVRFMLGKKGNTIYALNRKGKNVSVPNEIEKEAREICAGDFLLDGELVGDKYIVFDLLEIFGDCQKDFPFELRSLHARGIVSNKPNKFIEFISFVKGLPHKRDFYNQLIKDNAEGIVFKRLGSTYNVGRPSSGGNYLKFKFYSTASCVVAKINQKRSVSLEMACGTNVGNVTISANYEIPEKGDIVEVRYLYAYQGGSLYQPTYLGVRTDVDADTLNSLKFKRDDDE